MVEVESSTIFFVMKLYENVTLSSGFGADLCVDDPCAYNSFFQGIYFQ